ncbi:translocation and assembly module lipoprotein TamL [Alistipes timonensis]|uniref:translocation and assembly module lipoprotein TamL n=1 Tax=Alistipes timonensis TaxID=1465754 RepID=UPI001C3D38BB|nr:BamA/TamA family outer membrane protein [Alistipes timonensis]MCR2031628.1 BamA/TamA family outer membrane protein [Alistipes timonensis]
MNPKNIRNSIVLLAAAALLAACSTTRRLGADEVLYTGVKKIRIEPDSGVVLSATAESAVKEPLSVAPNNPLYSPYLRTPLPIGLWAWNYFYTPKEKGFKYWFYKRLAKQPVLISKVQPELRTRVAEQVLENYGYFGSRASDSLLYRKHGRKAKVNYTLRIAPPFRYAEISYPAVEGGLKPLVDSMHATSLLRTGAQYNLDTLTLERQRIARLLRNRGYYYFRPEYLEYLADTTISPQRVAVRLNLKPNIPAVALKPYRVGDITVRLTNIRPGPTDTLRLRNATVIAQQPMKIRPKILARALALEPGQLFTVDAQSRTQTSLNKLGIFRSVNLSVTPLDSLRGADTLDVTLEAQFDYPLEAALETDVTTKSNSFIGPGITFKLSNNNLFRGGEVLALKLNGSYEWQTGNRNSGGRSSRLNSYELGLNANLNIPRLLLPESMTRRLRYPGSTSFQLGVDLMNRPSFFRLIAFSGSAGYNFQTSPYSRHGLTVFKLTYNKLLHTTESFDRTMDENPAIAMSFRNQFVPSIGYTYTFDKTYGATGNRRLYWQNSVTSAGNLLSGILRAFGERQPQNLFGNRFSQFAKEVSELKFYHRLGRRNNWLATRLLVGVGYAYGNSEVMPYSEQFYIGGANSLRAFTVRSLGPGSYRPPRDDRNGYLDQTGDFKLEANVEYRFGLLGKLGGAVFLDAGNIWLLKNDPKRPGAELKWKGFLNEIALGTGFGLRYDISVLVIRADLGIGLHTPYPNPDKKGYYNISSFKDGLGFHLAIGYPF